MKIEKLFSDHHADSGDDHFSSNAETPLRSDAFEKSYDEKILIIQEHYRSILETIGMDLTDYSLKGTPLLVAKMFVNATFGGFHPRLYSKRTRPISNVRCIGHPRDEHDLQQRELDPYQQLACQHRTS